MADLAGLTCPRCGAVSYNPHDVRERYCGHCCHDFIADAELGRDMAKISAAERLARAVLLFHRGAPWTAWDSEVWLALTGSSDATTKTLCDLARLVRASEEVGP